MKIESYEVKQADNGRFSLWIETDGKTEMLDYLPENYELYNSETKKEAVEGLLSQYGIEVKEKEKVTLKQRPKVFLKLASEKLYGYALYLKGTSKYVYRITDGDTISVADEANSPKVKPVYFTKEDLNVIGNLDSFDVKKVELKGRKYNLDKLSGRTRAKK